MTRAIKAKYIYLYNNSLGGVTKPLQRQIKFAETYASIINAEFKGIYPNNIPIKNNVILIPNNPISHSLARQLGIQNEHQIFGTVIDPLHAEKSIYHLPVPDSTFVPKNFPFAFAQYLNDNMLVLPGYTAFSKRDALVAYDLLAQQGYIVRLKNPLGSGGYGQLRLGNKESLIRYLDSISMELLKKFGLVLEANLIPAAGHDKLQSIGSALNKIDGQIYCYLVEVNFRDRNGNHLLSDILVHVTKGDLSNLSGKISPMYDEAIVRTTLMEEAMSKLPAFISSRCVWNFIYGEIDTANKSPKQNSLATFYAVEHTLRVGLGVGSLLLAVKTFMKTPQAKMVVSTSAIQSVEKAEEDVDETIYSTEYIEGYGIAKTASKIIEVYT